MLAVEVAARHGRRTQKQALCPNRCIPCELEIIRAETIEFSGFGDQPQYLENRMFLNNEVFNGESSQPDPNEYSPIHFDDPGYPLDSCWHNM